MNILFLGDVIGEAGCRRVQKLLPEWKRKYQADVCIINGENSAEGNGITADSAEMLFSAGADVITTGNHVLRRREVYDLLDRQTGVLRPLNYHPSAPGSGIYYVDLLRWQLCVINLQGQTYMEPCDNPFEKIDAALKTVSTKLIFVDFHAEATSEKIAMGHYLDGRVSAVIGTHTHVQTADERILPKGTAYLTDAGMCGGKNSVLGVKKELIIQRFIDHLPVRHEYDGNDIEVCGCLIELDEKTGKARKIQRLKQ